MRLTKIYTKVGDKGTTLLASGQKVSKSADRIEAYGTVDELNSHLGLLADMIAAQNASFEKENRSKLTQIQNELFDLGGELATPNDILDVSKQQVVTRQSIARLESEIDRFNQNLPALENFVLPGGHPIVSQCHVVRCVCRRAERRIVSLAASEEIRVETQVYVNRLSDWLFVYGRFLARGLNVEEKIWSQNK